MSKLQTVYRKVLGDWVQGEETLMSSDGEYVANLEEKEGYFFTPEELTKLLSDTFQAAREFNSQDGVVDVDVVLPMGGDMSDLQAVWITAEEYIENFLNKEK